MTVHRLVARLTLTALLFCALWPSLAPWARGEGDAVFEAPICSAGAFADANRSAEASVAQSRQETPDDGTAALPMHCALCPAFLPHLPTPPRRAPPHPVGALQIASAHADAVIPSAAVHPAGARPRAPPPGSAG
jgi:hypothetical protein